MARWAELTSVSASLQIFNRQSVLSHALVDFVDGSLSLIIGRYNS
jgi:hypothetical protein